MTSVAPVSAGLPVHAGTWQHQEEILPELKAGREMREADRRERAGPAADKHAGLIFYVHMWGKENGEVCCGSAHGDTGLDIESGLLTEICI